MGWRMRVGMEDEEGGQPSTSAPPPARGKPRLSPAVPSGAAAVDLRSAGAEPGLSPRCRPAPAALLQPRSALAGGCGGRRCEYHRAPAPSALPARDRPSEMLRSRAARPCGWGALLLSPPEPPAPSRASSRCPSTAPECLPGTEPLPPRSQSLPRAAMRSRYGGDLILPSPLPRGRDALPAPAWPQSATPRNRDALRAPVPVTESQGQRQGQGRRVRVSLAPSPPQRRAAPMPSPPAQECPPSSGMVLCHHCPTPLPPPPQGRDVLALEGHPSTTLPPRTRMSPRHGDAPAPYPPGQGCAPCHRGRGAQTQGRWCWAGRALLAWVPCCSSTVPLVRVACGRVPDRGWGPWLGC